MEWAKNVSCKNITIYGFCRYENKGCAFRHDNNKETSKENTKETTKDSTETDQIASETKTLSSGTSSTLDQLTPESVVSRPHTPTPKATVVSQIKTTTVTAEPKRFNVDSQAFKPIRKSVFSKITTSLSDIPSFVPSTPTKDNPETPSGSGGKSYNFDLPAFQPSGYLEIAGTATPPPSAVPPEPMHNPTTQEMYFTAPSSFPLKYHLYAPTPPPHLKYIKQNEETADTLFIDSELRQSVLKQNEALQQQMDHSSLPESVSMYHSLVPLDKTLEKNAKHYGVASSIYKVTSNADGNVYALRRLEGFQLINEKAMVVVNRWKSVPSNANIVRVQEAFTSHAFGDNSLYFVYDYYPLAKTLREKHRHNIANEPLLWSYIVQIANALSTIHEKNLAARLVTQDKILVTGKNKLRLSSCGILDVVNFDEDNSRYFELGLNNKLEYYKHLQSQDLKDLGIVLLELISRIPVLETQDLSLMVANLEVSQDLKLAISYLVNGGTIKEFSSIIAPQMMKTLNEVSVSSDYYESQLTNEIENDRLVRLLTKLSFINERPEYQGDIAWSETGERYPIKLFRDLVFHQVDQEGKPVVDLAFVLKHLNKLDAGIDEKILLVSRDENSCIIATYKELKVCIEASFRDLIKSQNNH